MTPIDDKARAEMQAQYRFLVINLCRIIGAILLVLGLAVIARETFESPRRPDICCFWSACSTFSSCLYSCPKDGKVSLIYEAVLERGYA